MRSTSFLWICSILHFGCGEQLSIRDELLREKSEWLEPGRDRRFLGQAPVETAQPCVGEQPEEIEDLQKNLKISEKQLSKCEATLVKLQLIADVSNNGKLDANLVYLKKIIVGILNRFDGGHHPRRGVPSELSLSLSEKERGELRQLLDKLDQNSVPRMVEKMQDVINKARVTYDGVESHSFFRQWYLDMCLILGEMDLFLAIQLSIAVCAILFVYIAATCRSKLVTLSYLLLFGAWISYFWHWQTMLRRSQANRHILIRNNPCEDNRAFYNPLRFFHTNSEECEKYLRKMFTPMFWEFTPMEVLFDMVATYTSNLVSVLIVNIMGAVGDAVRDFADKQSWFSILPAFLVLFMVLLVLLFKLSGWGVSLFYGAVRLQPPQEQPRIETRQPRPTLERSTFRVPRGLPPTRRISWQEGHRSRVRPTRYRAYDSDSDGYQTAGEL
ncbi:uncharacterized protein LOC100902164 [Galendromus occidentalis]|uniref:Chloride channel CLIC-like protein 1 n=1 Tax=Galendromus occidentalis TaxID=34638 RepID=A0AAJ7SE53_9ACAR|nr:uncharacterized protein LOC100902164 [Galendromus occidentalis]